MKSILIFISNSFIEDFYFNFISQIKIYKLNLKTEIKKDNKVWETFVAQKERHLMANMKKHLKK